ncbi:sucrose operon repressor (plasmid) [Bacillus cereus]|uniref:LacI family DNA-binding transcriptional regulator n=1 Tax=Bacillus TaxID=1386 RepID=UPI0001A11A9D|nr:MULTISPECIES: LacI family DNA-binding transcriptional regulator [Bacillus]EEL78948.1 Sucrose operon repressor [Bacillus cereus AH1271]MBG9837783.1 LacI family transcriptional regulator [Bacillus tropicus]MBG9877944.1 LacI family transcriptional regulator [Bacillus tropicus]MBG9921694.1 LacI family transcriptional regulator [Bacillus tropicus]MBJ8353377.1 LacI family transcriptional regulator [Bacillus mycoides]
MAKNISDIAKLAGVAKSTVSRYLNGGSVSEKTKQKIEVIIEKTNFSPNTFARSLKAKTTNLIGVIVPRLDSFATTKTLIGIDNSLREHGYQMLVANANQSYEIEIEAIENFVKQKVAGIILLTTKLTEQHNKVLDKLQIPVLFVGQQYEGQYCLIHNDFEASFELGAYILSQGHFHIAYVGVTEEDVSVGLKRRQGFQKAVQMFAPSSNVTYYKTTFHVKDAMKQVSEILSGNRPTVIVCATDNIAIGAIKVIHEKQLSVPVDISVTGFGGYDISEMIHPSLTTVSFDYHYTGTIAATSIIQLVENKEIPKVITSKYELKIRESIDKV